jgi:hypothetical protein
MFWPHLKLGLQVCFAMIPLGSSVAAAATQAKLEGDDFFEAKIRPVLAEHCYKCHSASAEKVKGDLLLDSREAMLKGGESGKPVIVPGDADRSRLIEAIRYSNEDLQMPPKKAGGKLSDAQISDFVAWVNLGAPDPRTNRIVVAKSPYDFAKARKFWSFQPPTEPPLPKTQIAGWSKSAIDDFILAKLEEKGLQPSLPADKRTLIRRATYDLTGLPPTAAEVEAYLKDHSPKAFARVVDRLLSSPRYGERWGRYWLDVARYSDTKGYVYSDREEGRFVHSSAYRDWVIRAFNEDMPYDRFLRLQIAADQIVGQASSLSPSTSERSPEIGKLNGPQDRRDLAAMGFLTLGRRFLGVVHDIIDDRIDVVMRGTQGLTVSCARCHDHKFDPIPTRDYYSLYGIFNGSTERELPLVTDLEQNERFAEFAKGLHEREEKLDKTFRKKCDELSERLRGQSVQYLAAVLEVDKLPSEEFYAIRGPDDLNPTIVRQWDNYLRLTAGQPNPVFALWHEFEKLPEKDFAARAAELVRSLSAPTNSTSAPDVPEPQSAAGILPADQSVQSSAGRMPAAPWGRPSPVVLQAFATNPPSSMQEVAKRYGELLVNAHRTWLDALKNAGENKTLEALPDRDQEELRRVLYGADSPVLVPSGAIVDLEWFFDEGGRVELGKLQAEIDRWINKSASPPYAVILADRQTQRNPRVFMRGNPVNKGPEVPRQFLEILAGENRKAFSRGSGRLELAEAIASRENPLTARVMVNRIWSHHFGAGLVRTPSDFGTRCEAPSHPELLDWLACRFMADNWSIKKLHRLIMLSAVYQQSSEVGQASSLSVTGLATTSSKGVHATEQNGETTPPHTTAETTTALTPALSPERGRTVHNPQGFSPASGQHRLLASAATIDPENRLLWHFNRHRLDFESARDSLLAVSDELDANTGGKSVELFNKPFARRRTVYGFVDRQFLPGVFRVFDFANPDMHSPQRLDTTVPQQALFFMNSPFVVERARALAGRVEAVRNPESRIQELYHLVFQRPASARQIDLAKGFLASAESLPPPEPPKPVVSPWQYGFGEYDEAAQRVKNFEALPHFTGDSWQGGAAWPDTKLGWVQLTAQGGHAGNDLQHAAIRRWIAPRDAVVSIGGTLLHEHKEGDGIRGRIISDRAGQLGSWTLHNDKAETKFESVEVRSGDAIDFVVDFNANLNNDDFKWSPVIKLKDQPAGAASGDYAGEWNAKKDFGGPPEQPPRPLSAWEKYAQVLLLSNEFMFVD